MKVILVVGPSGSGKDTLLRHARSILESQDSILFSRRYITRPPDSNEDNYYVDQYGFEQLQSCGFFLATWEAHNNLYGIPHHIFTTSEASRTVICSISRTAVEKFEEVFPDSTTIHITTDNEILKQRLSRRGREDENSIIKRIQRSKLPVKSKNLITFDNSVTLEESKQKFISLLCKLSQTEHLVSITKNLLQFPAI